MQVQKQQVYDFWNAASCGEALFLPSTDREGYRSELQTRYRLEPYILDFARFEEARGQKVLEIGVGLGADHQRFAEAGADLHGIDLTERAVEHCRKRLACFGLNSHLAVGDAEALAFEDNTFDLVYSWGVIHHSPDTRKAAREILRVLKPGGRFKVMIYNRHSMIGLMLWLRYALLAGRPFRGLDDVYAGHLESPGTKAYTRSQAAHLFRDSKELRIATVLTHGDLLEGQAGQRHEGRILSLARMFWPRALIRWAFPNAGLFMLISGIKAVLAESPAQ